MLDQRVKSGELPPVNERLPKDPYVVGPGVLVAEAYLDWSPGSYGGTLQLPQLTPTGDPTIYIANVEPLLWAPAGVEYTKGLHGNVVAGYEIARDYTVFTFHLREGLRWSDGELAKMEDVQFALEDVLFNDELTPLIPAYLRAGNRLTGAPAKPSFIDDQTFSLTFDEPYGSFPAQLGISGWYTYGDIIKPRHYLEQFHKKYASPNALRKLLSAEDIPQDQWYKLFNEKQLTGWMWNISNQQGLGHPTFTPWLMTRAGSGQFHYERNPYYFKVDTAGRQLPYIDALHSQLVQTPESLTSRALFGEFDYLGARASFRKLPVMADRADAGKIKLAIPLDHNIPVVFFLNLTHRDEVWRSVVRDVRLRRALSMAINRKEMIETFYLGKFARLPQRTNPPVYDVAKANRLLDEVGLQHRDSDGFRLGPDGVRFRVPFEIADLTEDHIPATELVAEYWKNVGIYTTIRQVLGSARQGRLEANKIKATAQWLAYPLWESLGWDDYLPTQLWAPLWEEWRLMRNLV